MSASQSPGTFWTVPFLDLANHVWSMPEEQWIDDSPVHADIAMLEKEASDTQFDTACNLRSEMIAAWKKGDADLHIKELPGRTRLVFLGTEAQWSQIPWALWARILQAIGHPIGYILFYAHHKLREYPASNSSPIEPQHVNAGYTTLCEQDTLVIYRFEEATRVLVHELLHTACFDKDLPVEDLEASTEAWAELFLCAMLSKGKKNAFLRLWRLQCAWIEAQTVHLKTVWNIKGRADYCWRYLIGRHEVLKAKGFMLPSVKGSTGTVGLRFTTPEWELVPQDI